MRKEIKKISTKMRPQEKSPNKSSGFFVTALRIFICIIALWITILAYIEKQNDLTELRLAIPNLAKAVKNIEEENVRLEYEIEHFKSPVHLMELSRKPEFGHLKASFFKDEIFLSKEPPLLIVEKKIKI